ncbi:phage tail protein [Coprococcus comes]|uniref:phage tail protein n=1 Tax=Coprococcus comes TaxID=410072 RepID=UPI0015714F10|nr:hypothetical protein [Coprococcus comes]NSD32062.1 hypothetical protein [Coprococcus comes]
MDIFSLVGKITINYADAVNNIEKVSKSAKDTAETLEDVDKKADGAGDSVEDAGQAAKNADSGFTTWKATLANLASTAITKVISGCAQLAEKMADVTKSAVGHYAEYEQLVGGVETLFKDSSGKLIDYAEKAYKTAGMSSNQYMDTATSFAASLIQGLGGDTAKAVELTNLAITDMSDNANKMGTDIGSIQDAYQGFAKQNYTMLDNLKLGYGGTQSEMIRLINDSGVLGEKIESLDNVTFDQMIEAIHKIQDNLGITGTTALEAGTTISGSWSSVQALFENILTKVGSKLAPTIMGFLQQLSDWMETIDWDAFATSVGDALQRVFDWIQKIDFTTFFEKGMDGVTEFIEDLGDFATKVIEVIGNIQSFIDILITLSPIILGVVTTLGSLALASKIGEIIDSVKTAMTGLFAAMSANPIVAVIAIIAGLVVALVTLWNTNDGFREAVTNAWEKIKEVFGTVIDAIKGFFSGLVEKVQAAWESVKETVTNVFTAIADTVSAVWETIKNVITVGIMLIGSIIDAAFQIITLPWRFIWENCKEYIISAWNYIKDTVSSALNIISSVISDAWNTVSSFLTYILSNIKNKFVSDWNAIKSVVSNVLLMISSTVTSVMNSIWSVVSSILNVIKSVFSSAWNGIKSVVSSAVNNIKSVVSSGLNGAKSTVTGVLNSIRSAFSSVWDGCKNIVGNAIGYIKSLMNFSWSLPHLKLPHISISGSFSLKPPSVPHFGIEWYKKAMDDGMIMNQPTIFGYNAKSNQFLAGGEAGSETVVGTHNLMDMIQEAVNNAGSGNGDSEATRALLEAIFNWMRNGGLYKLLIDVLTNGVEFEFDNREIARLVKKYA